MSLTRREILALTGAAMGAEILKPRMFGAPAANTVAIAKCASYDRH